MRKGFAARLAIAIVMMPAWLAAPAMRTQLLAEGRETLRRRLSEVRAKRGWLATWREGALEAGGITRAALLSRWPKGRGALRLPRGDTRKPMTLMTDVRLAWRRLVSGPAAALLAGGMLAIAIGLAAAMFTVVDALLIRPAPFPDADRLVTAHIGDAKGRYRQTVAPALVRAWRDSPAFDAVHATAAEAQDLDANGEVTTESGVRVTAGLFEMLGARPQLGRSFVPGEGRTGTDDRVIIAGELWRSRFGADPAVIGRRVRIAGQPVEIVGVMPDDFRFPSWRVTMWRPMDVEAPPAAPWATRLYATVRRAPDVSPEQAAAVAAAQLHVTEKDADTLRVVFRSIIGTSLDAYSRGAVTVLAAGVGLVFLALAANVAGLLLSRMTVRRREFAICAAMGASRLRLLRQAAFESAMLGAAGSLAGVGIAAMLVAAAQQWLPDAFLLRTLNALDVDRRALLAASAFGVLATMTAGVLPAWMATRARGDLALRTDRGGTESRAQRVASKTLLIAEVALATMLLVGAGLLGRSFVNLMSDDRGLDADGVVTAWIRLPAYAFADRPSRYAYADALERELRAVPGVAEVAMSYGVPPNVADTYFGDWRTDDPSAAPQNIDVSVYAVGSEFFQLYRLPLLEGRMFGAGDGPRDVILGERLARRLFPGRSAVGGTFGTNNASEFRVIGVTREIRSPGVDPREDAPEMYRPLRVLNQAGQVEASAFGGGMIYASLRCRDGCRDITSLRAGIRRVHAEASIYRLSPLEAQYADELASPRAAAALAAVFAVIATLAAGGGLFSVLSYAVGRRRREFGVRVALGAAPAALRRTVVADGVRVTLAGLIAGIGLAYMLARALAALEYGVTWRDPLTWTAVIAILLTAALAASWSPARRAARSDPAALLRSE